MHQQANVRPTSVLLADEMPVEVEPGDTSGDARTTLDWATSQPAAMGQTCDQGIHRVHDGPADLALYGDTAPLMQSMVDKKVIDATEMLTAGGADQCSISKASREQRCVGHGRQRTISGDPSHLHVAGLANIASAPRQTATSTQA